jgi:hypothetical protein
MREQAGFKQIERAQLLIVLRLSSGALPRRDGKSAALKPDHIQDQHRGKSIYNSYPTASRRSVGSLY